MGMLVGMGCMDKKFQHFFAPPFFKGFILIVLFFFHLPRLCNAITHCNKCINKHIYKFFVFCIAYTQFKKEMHKYSINNTKTMDSYQQEIALIQKILKENPKGMTVTDISRKIKINRNSVAKYLDIMKISGMVEMITFGPAKVYFPSRRIPITDMINYISDFIVVFDSDMKITMINDSFLRFLGVNRVNIIGQSFHDTLLKIFEDKGEIFIGINQALEGKNFKQEIDLKKNNDLYFFNVNIMPITFEDGKQGATLILRNITDKKIAENILRESEENFRRILDKINKK